MESNPSTLRTSDARLIRLMILVSGLLLTGVFYMNGTFSRLFTAVQPSAPEPQIAAAAPAYTDQTASVSDVVTKALAFKALLTTTQQATLQQTYTTTLARKWSNLPCGASCRNGIEFGVLTSAELTAAMQVIQATLSSNANDGYDEFVQNRLAESYLHTHGGGSGYDSTLRWISFLNTPSATGPWMLQFGGHHYAANIAFNNGHVIGATPFFEGLEPTSFAWGSATYAPLTDEHDAMTAMLASLTTTQLATAKLTTTFSDCTMVPGESNGGTGTFPATKVGIACSALSTTQKNLVLAAIGHYVNDMDTATANAIMAVYTSEIDGTYIAYTGSGTSGNASSFLNTNSNYVRIDGPTVWIELACQNGVVFSGQIHYHTVWRDHSHDYGVDLTGAAIDQSSVAGISEVKATQHIMLYPNPANDNISLSFGTTIKDGTLMVISAATGQSVKMTTHVQGKDLQVDVSGLAPGLYIVKIEDKGTIYTGKFSKL